MQYTVQSIVSIIIFSGILLFFMHFIISKSQLIISISIRFLFICLLLISIRLLVPIELPFTRRILITDILPEIHLLSLRKISFLGNITVQSLLAFIWLIGAFNAVLYVTCSYAKLKRNISNLDCISDQNINTMLSKITLCYKKKASFKIVTTDKVSSPMIFGVFKPYIVIPDFKLPDKDLYYILSHEVAHYYHGDLFFKFMGEILHAIYWWNPVIAILKKHLSSLMEINIDKKLIALMSELQTLEYVQCLIESTKLRNVRYGEFINRQWHIGFNSQTTLTASKRIHLVLNEKKANCKSSFVSLATASLLLFLVILLPNLFIFEPYGVPDKIEKETFAIHEGNCYLISNPDNTYDLYVDNEYTITVDYIFDENIPIYQNLEEIPKND